MRRRGKEKREAQDDAGQSGKGKKQKEHHLWCRTDWGSNCFFIIRDFPGAEEKELILLYDQKQRVRTSDMDILHTYVFAHYANDVHGQWLVQTMTALLQSLLHSKAMETMRGLESLSDTMLSSCQ